MVASGMYFPLTTFIFYRYPYTYNEKCFQTKCLSRNLAISTKIGLSIIPNRTAVVNRGLMLTLDADI